MPSPKLDWRLLIPVLLLSLLGLFILGSIAPQQLFNQSLFLAISALVFCLFAFTDFRVFFSLNYFLYLFSLLFLFSPVLFGTHSRGALRWLQIGEFSLQPSEIVKPFLLITFSVLANSSLTKKYFLLILSFLVPALIIFFQPDLGTVLVLMVGWITIFISKIPVKALVTLALVVIFVVPASWFILRPYQKQRLITFVNPYQDPLGAGYHVIQSITAVGSGQILGRGLGHGTQSQLRFLPEHYTDFVFASISEELGLIGAILILGLYLGLAHRLYIISQTITHPVASHFTLGVLSMLTFQLFINIGMNMGIAPITGITLPFLSYGGSSLLSLAIMLGLLNSISLYATKTPHFQIR